MKVVVKLLATFVLFMTSAEAMAWNMAGHMLTGSFVYQELAQSGNHAVLQRVTEVLREHPDYDTRWAATLSRAKSEEEETHLLLILAARWPDDARDDEEQHRAVWHYVSFPFGKGPTPGTNYDPKATPANLVQAYLLAADKVRGGVVSENPSETAIALCWLLHLGGDAHQPLHAVSMFSKRFPDGDQGGNKQYVRAVTNGQPLNLHSLWDGLVIGSHRIAAVRNEATRLRASFPASQFPEAAVLDPLTWTRDESFGLAKSAAYLDGKLRSTVKSRQDDAPVLPEGYMGNAKAIAEQRISLASHRLAATLRQLMPPQ